MKHELQLIRRLEPKRVAVNIAYAYGLRPLPVVLVFRRGRRGHVRLAFDRPTMWR